MNRFFGNEYATGVVFLLAQTETGVMSFSCKKTLLQVLRIN